MKNNIKLKSEDLLKYDVVAFKGETPLEIAQKVMDKCQVIFQLESLDSWLVVCPLPRSEHYLVRYKNHGQIFKNSGEASLCFLELVHECLYMDSLNFDFHDN